MRVYALPLLFCALYWFAWSSACQSVPPQLRIDLMRERLRTALVLAPPPELQNLTREQVRTLNQTINELVRLPSAQAVQSAAVDRELLDAVQRYLNNVYRQ